MEHCDCTEQFVLPMDKEVKEDELSTTEEEVTSLSGGSTSEAEDKEEQQWEALKEYSKRFGVDLKGEATLFNRASFGWHAGQEAQASCKPVAEVLADLERDLKEPALPESQTTKEQPAQPMENDDEDRLKPTFGYAGDLEEHSFFARFDIRDKMCIKVGGFKHGQVVQDRNGCELVVVGVRNVEGAPRLWFHPKSLGRPGAGAFRGGTLRCLQTRVTAVPGKVECLPEMRPDDFDGGDCSDDEDVVLCRHCRLPLGCHSYREDGNKRSNVHAECMAQLMQQQMSEEQKKTKQQDDMKKKKIRQDYDIGWCVDDIPGNATPAMKLGVYPAPQGMCCLVFNEASHSIAVAPTLEPAESTNLEYLSTALKVRLQEGREPLFSLDPVADSEKYGKDEMQEKRYEPEWLAGTNVGEVLFQSDYFLKELSFGEYEQPVVGMKSCGDFSEVDDNRGEKEWSAREWFVVKKAEVQLTDANVLIPHVKMGVEAREQVLVNGIYEDKPVTRKTHPMQMYAEQFTRFFDLIAERKSVIYHLRELAKASVLAKMLIENDVNMHGPWLELADEDKQVSSMEIPQLWNNRVHNHIELKATKIVTAADKNKTWGLYGGVNFGLQSQSVSMPSVIARGRAALSRIPTTTPIGAGVSAVSFVGRLAPKAMSASPAVSAMTSSLPLAAATTAVSAPQLKAGLGLTSVVSPGAASILTGRPLTSEMNKLLAMQSSRVGIPVPFRPSAGLAAVTTPMMRPDPRGVDLNLDEFNFSTLNRAEGHDWDDANHVKCVPMGGAFWASLDDDASTLFQSKDKALLRAVYDPNVSDRRDEGERFVPPDTSFSYVQKLRKFVGDEAEIRRRRKEHFCSKEFSMASPGPMFPRSFQATVEIAQGKSSNSNLYPRPDYKAQAHKFDDLLESTAPTFDKHSEEGTRYRIYHVGRLEVRTTQEMGAEEIIGAVYSKSVPTQRKPQSQSIADNEKLCKVTEYVEKFSNTRRSYTVLETERGDIILTEKLRDGTIHWEENPADLEDRNCLAKAIRSAVCNNGKAVSNIKSYQTRHLWESKRLGNSSSLSADCKRYAQGVFWEASGQSGPLQSGFAKPQPGAAKWRLSETQYGSSSALAADDAVPSFTDGKRPTTGDQIEIKETGRIGKIVFDDHTCKPYKVQFEDGESPASKWYKECDLQWPREVSK